MTHRSTGISCRYFLGLGIRIGITGATERRAAGNTFYAGTGFRVLAKGAELRGGSWNNFVGDNASCAARYGNFREVRFNYYGFRVLKGAE